MDESTSDLSLNKKSATVILSIYLMLLGLATMVMSLLPSWLGYKSSEAISYKVEDGWCEIKSQGIGNHCFGDFYYPLTMTNLSNPWAATPNPGTPATNLFYKFFAKLTETFPGQFPLVLFLALSLVSVVIPLIHIHLRIFHGSILKTSIVSLVVFSSSPLLISIDRGNNQFFAIPLMYFFIYSLRVGLEGRALVFGVILTLFKPQFALFVLVFFIYRNWRRVRQWITYSAAGYIVGFAFHYQSFPQNIKSWLGQVYSYNGYAEKGAVFPVNLSMSNLIEIVLKVTEIEIPDFFVRLMCYVIFCVAIGAIYRFGYRNSLDFNLFYISMLPIVFVETTFHYYLILILIPVCFIFIEAMGDEQKPDSSKRQFLLQGKILRFLFGGTLVLTFIPWSVPYVLAESLIGRGWSIIGINWLPGQFFLNSLMCWLVWCILRRDSENYSSQDTLRR